MTLPLINLSLSGDQFSDLYFNYEHPAYEALYRRVQDCTEEEYAAANKADATEFLLTLGVREGTAQFDDLLEPLVKDFEARI